ncbi:hypothetical protein ACTJKC_24765 [Pedobacter sp. 22226]|uniref:hypothetical protein n=1 Tax=Pedobacter sp. 22226 TaxID=3453894 RepID=UPI003F85CCD8
MKFIFSYLLAIIVSCLWFSCKQEQDYKTLRSEVVARHDKVMNDADLANGQKMVLDSIYRSVKSSGNKSDVLVDSVALIEVIGGIEKANNQMESWMNHFDPDISGKSEAEAIDYFKVELKKINNLDRQFKAAIVRSDRYLDSLHIEKRKALH